MSLFAAFTIAVGLNLTLFLPAYFLRTDKLTDISYALTFVALAAGGLLASGVSLPNLILALMVFGWAARLGAYLLVRIHKMGRDQRFDQMRGQFWQFGGFWLLQGFTVWMVLLPSILFWQAKVEKVSPYAFVGVALWLVGLSIEAWADWQKYRFRNSAANQGKWIESGLWAYSRHPNYFGEILLWFGTYVYCLFGLAPTQALLGALGPLYLALLLIFVSGIPLLERAAARRWGDNPDYLAYKRRTSTLLPLPARS